MGKKKEIDIGRYHWEVSYSESTGLWIGVMIYRGKERWCISAVDEDSLMNSMGVMNEQFEPLNPYGDSAGPFRTKWEIIEGGWISTYHRLDGPAIIEIAPSRSSPVRSTCPPGSTELHTYIIQGKEIFSKFKNDITDKDWMIYMKAVKEWEDQFFKNLRAVNR